MSRERAVTKKTKSGRFVMEKVYLSDKENSDRDMEERNSLLEAVARWSKGGDVLVYYPGPDKPIANIELINSKTGKRLRSRSSYWVCVQGGAHPLVGKVEIKDGIGSVEFSSFPGLSRISFEPIGSGIKCNSVLTLCVE